MRIVGGKWRGRKLENIGRKFQLNEIRPTTDRVKESLFNILIHGLYPKITGVRVLDLFSGTGALGLEALSRGANSACFVELNRSVLNILKTNINNFQLGEEAKIFHGDATNLGKNCYESFGLIFLDPPYNRGLGELALISAFQGNWLSKECVIVWEENSPINVPKGFELIETRYFGKTKINILILNSQS